MKINCISCGLGIELDDDTYEDYEGPVRCVACSALLNIRTADGRLRSVSMFSAQPPAAATPEPAVPAAAEVEESSVATPGSGKQAAAKGQAATGRGKKTAADGDAGPGDDNIESLKRAVR